LVIWRSKSSLPAIKIIHVSLVKPILPNAPLQFGAASYEHL
jgi:hypothetical protein